MRYHRACYETLECGLEVELPYDPEYPPDLLQQKVNDVHVIGYLAADRGSADPDDLMGDCMGKLYSLHRHAPKSDHEAVYEALGLDRWGNQPDPEDYDDPADMPQPNPDAVILDCYEHGSQWWSLHGEGTQCRWDTARGAGVWLPDKCLLDEAKDLTGDERRAKMVEWCTQFLESYNAINNGDVWGIIVAWYDEHGKLIDEDSCWGFVGGEWAQEELKTAFKWRCNDLKKKLDEEIRTASGRQVEMAL